MDLIKSITLYNTDIFNSWGIGQTTLNSSDTFEEVLNYAIKIKASIIVKPSRGKFWYIKGLNNNKSYDEIKNHLDNNILNKYKSKSKLWLIKYT
tara:strand:- start:689 stop:970 length:282 start_codon:yes stop_codon:yes gene_type:complete